MAAGCIPVKVRCMTRLLRLGALGALLLLPLSAAAEARIPLACRVKNRPPGRCGWCAVETLARHLHLRSLYGITRNNASRSNIEDLEEVISAAGVVYHLQRPGAFDTTILNRSVEAGLGVAVGFRELQPGAGGHIVTLVDFTDEEARVIDPNDRDGRIRTMTRERFLYWWDGFALVLEREAAAE
jgi:hypothetical protein